MTQKELDPLTGVENNTRDETDFGKFVRYMAQDGISAIQAAQDPEPIDEAKYDDHVSFLIGFTTHRVLKNRKEAGLNNSPFELWNDPGLRSWIQEFILDERVKIILARGIIHGFE